MKKQSYLFIMFFACIPNIVMAMDKATKLTNKIYGRRRIHDEKNREVINQLKIEIAQRDDVIATLKKNFASEHEGYRGVNQHLSSIQISSYNMDTQCIKLTHDNAELQKTINSYERSALLCCFGTIATGIYWYINQTPDKTE